jgi:hypothetical protein
MTKDDDKPDPIESFARRGTRRLVCAYAFAIVIAIIVAIKGRDSRYVVQAGIGLLLLGYFVFGAELVQPKR